MKHTIKTLGLLAALATGAVQADARDEVVAAFQKGMDDGSYRMIMTADTRQGTMTSTLDVQWPDRFRMKNEGGEFIILPTGTWMNAGGQWMKVPVNMSKMIEGYSKDAMEKGVDAIGEVTYVGTETVEGCSARHYSYNASGKFMGIDSNSEADVWVCEDSGLPIRLTSSEVGKNDTVVMVYDWETPIDIRAPN